jgi:hypothetical protein
MHAYDSIVLKGRILQCSDGCFVAKYILARCLYEQHSLTSELFENVSKIGNHPPFELVEENAEHQEDARATNAGAAVHKQRTALDWVPSFHLFDSDHLFRDSGIPRVSSSLVKPQTHDRIHPPTNSSGCRAQTTNADTVVALTMARKSLESVGTP